MMWQEATTTTIDDGKEDSARLNNSHNRWRIQQQ